MKTTVWITGDQLRPDISALHGCDPDETVILMVESVERSRQIPYHKQKLTLIWSAMRRFADELREQGWTVDYHAVLDDFAAGLRNHLETHTPGQIRLMEGAEYGVADRLAELIRSVTSTPPDISITPNSMFLSDKETFAEWAASRKTLVMEHFYRDLRRKYDLLMEDGKPAGGQWNYDKSNRKPPPQDHSFPVEPEFPPDAITRDVMDTVDKLFPDHFGNVDGFNLPVTRDDADRALRIFLDERLDLFGPLQDAMVAGQPMMYHSQLSPLLNIGLLDPLTVCREAEKRYRDGSARLESVEGFIRQVLGWREFVYQVYHHAMPGYTERNQLNADLPLPSFYWDAETDMRCVHIAVRDLIERGINHHIQRLMVTGNFALLAGIDPHQVNEWYWLAYTDAYQWVVSPNVLGMALYADGGLVATKPYAASANYINRMSDYCSHCQYDPKQITGEQACPFNALYWDFLNQHRDTFAANHRMGLMLKNLDRKSQAELDTITSHAGGIRERIRTGKRL